MFFKDLQLGEPILKALTLKGYSLPTEIQLKSIPAVLAGRDVLACAQTGSGKTAAFVLPMLQLINQQKKQSPASTKNPLALILTPTRELAVQIADNISNYKKFLALKHTVIFGGVPPYQQVKELNAGTDLLVATPGRLLDLMNQKSVDLQSVRFFVLDEADRMLDSGFLNDVKKIIKKLPQKKQTLLFSATLPPEIKELSKNLLVNPAIVEVHPVSSTVEKINQSVFLVEKHLKQTLLVDILKDTNIDRALVFTTMKHHADKIAKQLVRSGIHAEAIHGNKSQRQRQLALDNFKSQRTRVLIATDIVARGIDIDELSHVINYELPDVPETYVHRIGRTGRKGNSGTAISFCSYEEKIQLNAIQKLISKSIPVASLS